MYNDEWIFLVGLLGRGAVDSYAQTKRFHIDRTFGGHCDHRTIDRDTDAGTAASEETGQDRCLLNQTQAVVSLLLDVCRGP